ncbi:sensor domain-containing diguanylate cyclase [Deinococcus hopiensis]|uniref:Diguanylate cyclase (GGDEF) domain-containing protein n=1 Tax=Deinococcus hopiensis KR-140 TaxID=695939 RepID=A0A1W1VLR7_9DEIO|nr:sensor domain-containing diguanylate cyclase [Deinococcus hopiensis]SMB94325.1 diguanylate cyclase (GGDEF) domain-containing protein [Deinococcus hopiensis KR-140]
MPAAPLPEDEYGRLLDLARYDILDTAPEETFDRLTRLAARALQAPAAIINFVDQHRQWGKSCFGTGDSTAPRERSFCAWTILGGEVLEVPDAALDPRFQDNAQVTEAPFIRMYAGAPLVTPLGHRLGSICIIDSRPRTLSAEDRATLQDLAALVMDELELRLRQQELERQVEQQGQQLRDLQRFVSHAQVLEEVNSLLDSALTPEEATLAAAQMIGATVYADWTGLITVEGEDLSIQVAHHQPDLSPALLEFALRLPRLVGGVTRSLHGAASTVYLQDYATHPLALPEAVEAGIRAAAWLPLGHFGETTFLLVVVRAERGPRAAWRQSDRALLDAAGRSVRAALEHRTALALRDQMARQDALTGVGNRRAFEEALTARLASGGPFTLGLIDLDGFKGVNDNEGHATGDHLLRVFATALRGELRRSGEVYRYGGDEFTLLLDPLGEDDVLECVDVAVLAARQVTVQPVGASVGLIDSKAGSDARSLIERADERMYREKARRQMTRGQNRTVE